MYVDKPTPTQRTTCTITITIRYKAKGQGQDKQRQRQRVKGKQIHDNESWEKELAPALWYDNTPSWDQTYHYQSFDWQTQDTSTWQDEHLPNGGAEVEGQKASSKEMLPGPNGGAEVEGKEASSKEMLPGGNLTGSNIGLMIEEDDADEQPEEGRSVGSSEEI
jgi:hypothetical protein